MQQTEGRQKQLDNADDRGIKLCSPAAKGRCGIVFLSHAGRLQLKTAGTFIGAAGIAGQLLVSQGRTEDGEIFESPVKQDLGSAPIPKDGFRAPEFAIAAEFVAADQGLEALRRQHLDVARQRAVLRKVIETQTSAVVGLKAEEVLRGIVQLLLQLGSEYSTTTAGRMAQKMLHVLHA